VLAILSFAVAVSGFNSTKMFEASRQLALRRITLIDLAAQISGLTCMLAWVAVDRSIWALVAGNFCWSVTMMLLSHAWLPGTPNCWAWDKSAFQEIFHFGKWIFTSSILSFLVSNGDRLLLGGMVDTTVLGVYVIAFLIVSSVEAALIRIIGAVTFPALSEIVRERPAHLKTNYYRLHAVVASFAYFCSGVLMMSGQSLINVLYDARYAQAGWMVEVLASALVIAPFQVSIQCFMALGKPQLNSSIFAVRLVSLFVAMPVGFHFFGLPGALWASVSSQFLCLPMIIFYNVRHGLFDLRQELLLLPVVLAGMGAGSLLAFLSRNYP
jgi:O-antigen/teichoic acid export membrane protein